MSYDGFADDQEQRDILLGFVEEAREMLDEVEPLLVELEQTAEEQGAIDLEMVNTVFRLFHSLKGGAGFLDLQTISGVTHEAETLLDMFRKGTGELTNDHIDLMNQACDFIRELIDQIENEFHDRGREDRAGEIAERLKQAIRDLKGEGEQPVEKADDSGKEEVEQEEQEEAPVAETESTTSADMNLEEFQITMGPEIIKQFVNEGEENLEKAEEALLSLEQDPANSEHVQQAFRAFHSFKGNSGFLGLKDMEKLSHSAESVLEQFRTGDLAPSSKVLNLILEIIDFLRNGMSALESGGSADIPATPGLVHLLEDFSGTKSPAKPAPKPETKEPEKKEEKQEEKPAVEEKKEKEPQASEKPAQKAKVEEKPKTDKKPEPKKPPTAAATKASATAAPTAPKAQPVKRNTTQRQSVRVDVEKLDILLDLVGELVISEAMVAQNPDIKALGMTLERFEKAVMQLDKITRDLQDVATSIRMIPLSGTFRRMVRLVRDLSQKAGKKVDFIILGEETEVDKTVIEQITDPLIHIIRNSIDHGIEVPDERQAAGKEAIGKLTLEAKYVGGEVWISVLDDGRGLNRERILNRAIERGLIDGDPEALSDDEVWQFIFNPGFSTAEKITDVSGRGVGMDVVKRNIENIRGKVDIKSWKGHGSEIILRLPLTLAIIDGMIIRVGDERYTMPITAIKESIQAQPEMVTETMDGQEILRIREHLIPVVRLHELFEIETDVEKLEDGIITVVENEGRQVCLLVDELIGQQQVVIKGLSDFVSNHPCVSGCTILGDGDISLILDIAGIIGHSESNLAGVNLPGSENTLEVVNEEKEEKQDM